MKKDLRVVLAVCIALDDDALLPLLLGIRSFRTLPFCEPDPLLLPLRSSRIGARNPLFDIADGSRVSSSLIAGVDCAILDAMRGANLLRLVWGPLLLFASLCHAVLVAVTGARGVLGRALVERLASESSVTAIGVGSRDCGQQDVPFPKGFAFRHGDLSDLGGVVAASREISLHVAALSPRRVVLVNAAGVCLEGRAPETFRHSIAVNALFPILLAQNLATSIEAPLQVINVSSGDGQRCFLDLSVQHDMSLLEGQGSLPAWERYCREFCPSDPHAEVAFGDTPAYSLSKALLTLGSALLHASLSSSSSSSSSGAAGAVSICPGNFLSKMTSDAEAAEPLRDPRDAAADVWTAISSFESFCASAGQAGAGVKPVLWRYGAVADL